MCGSIKQIKACQELSVHVSKELVFLATLHLLVLLAKFHYKLKLLLNTNIINRLLRCYCVRWRTITFNFNLIINWQIFGRQFGNYEITSNNQFDLFVWWKPSVPTTETLTYQKLCIRMWFRWILHIIVADSSQNLTNIDKKMQTLTASSTVQQILLLL